MTPSLHDGLLIPHVTARVVVAVFAFAAVFYALLCVAGLARWLQIRAGIVTRRSACDAMRGRLADLRAHPGLPHLGPGVLKVAAE